MDPISIAMGLTQFAPMILKWITGSDKVEQVANHVVAIAQGVTGAPTGPEALEVLRADAALQIKFREHLADNELEFDRMFLADVQSARARDVEVNKQGRNYRADFMFALAVIMIGALVYMVWKSQEIGEFVKGIVTLVLGRFLGYLDNIYNFEFGSTRASRSKDATIENLTK